MNMEVEYEQGTLNTTGMRFTADNMFRGTGNLTDLHTQMTVVGNNPVTKIPLFPRITPIRPANTPPIVHKEAVYLSSKWRKDRMDNILSAAANIGDAKEQAKDPFAGGRKADASACMHIALNEFFFVWTHPSRKQSLQVIKEKKRVVPNKYDPLSHKTIPSALDMNPLKPYANTTFNGMPMKDLIKWNSPEGYWEPTFRTSNDMMNAITVVGVNRTSEKAAIYEQIYSNHSCEELPLEACQIATFTVADIFAKRTVVDNDGKFRVPVDPVVFHEQDRIEWFIPEFDNTSPHVDNRMLIPVDKDGKHIFPGDEQVFYVKATGALRPREWKWIINPKYLFRHNRAKPVQYRDEEHFELLWGIVSPDATTALESTYEKKIALAEEFLNSTITIVDLKKLEQDRFGEEVFSEETRKALLVYRNGRKILDGFKAIQKTLRMELEDEIHERERRVVAVITKLHDKYPKQADIMLDTSRF